MIAGPQNGISIIVPCYNCPNYLKRLLKSIYSDSLSLNIPFETIVVDTSPTNSTEQIETEQICKHFRVKYISGKWRSVSKSRNTGVKNASFDKLFFIDADCEILPGTLQEHLCLSNESNDLAGSVGLTRFNKPCSKLIRAIKP